MTNYAALLPEELIVIVKPAGFELQWSPVSDPPDQDQWDAQHAFYESVLADPWHALLQVGLERPHLLTSDSLGFLLSWARHFVVTLTTVDNLDAIAEHVEVAPTDEAIQEALAAAPYLLGQEHLDSKWLTMIWDRLGEAFRKDIQDFSGTVTEYFQSHHADRRPLGRVCFHLVESKDATTPFAFLATYAPDSTGGGSQVPLKNALTEYQTDQPRLLSLLSTVSRAGEASPFISGLMESGEIFHPLKLTSQEAYTFLKEVPLYERSGILCRIPRWWQSPGSRIRARVAIGQQDVPSRIGVNALLDFHANLALGDQAITPEEIQELLAQTEGLAFLKGKWVEVDHEALSQLLQSYERLARQSGSISFLDAMRLDLYRGEDGSLDATWKSIEVSHGTGFNELMDRLKHGQAHHRTTLDVSPVKAHLRDYQHQGAAWLADMARLGLGALLADDMGLGKTLQVLTLLTTLRQAGPLAALVVAPASLLGNWLHEISQFTPQLTVRVAHPSAPDGLAQKSVEPVTSDIVLTTYGMIQREDGLPARSWDVVVLDEAQAVKNPTTKTARAVRSLKSRFRIALTGTPIENRLFDLWSLFNFLNPGLLGSASEFTRLTKALKDHPEGYAPLKEVVSPFILRRLKTDQRVIQDLPEKIEITARARLTRRQTALYLEVVHDLDQKLRSLPGDERRGLVLASLMKLKQICNHPDQYLGQTGFEPRDSGKFQRLQEIAEVIYDKRERVLIFTQFREMTEPLSRFLETLFHQPGLVLHGNTPVRTRHDLVKRFQDDSYIPFMVLSLKAGGVGLNLTRASHVVHFDRWWNPAVENQATDRAFRIGQTRNVMVHKFVTEATIEEKIDAMMADKRGLAEDVVPALGERWIGDLDDEALHNLFRLEVAGADVAIRSR